MGKLSDKLLGAGVKAITEGIDTLLTSKEEKQTMINELEADKSTREKARERCMRLIVCCKRFML